MDGDPASGGANMQIEGFLYCRLTGVFGAAAIH